MDEASPLGFGIASRYGSKVEPQPVREPALRWQSIAGNEMAALDVRSNAVSESKIAGPVGGRKIGSPVVHRSVVTIGPIECILLQVVRQSAI
jgi:hypothetical protein